MENPTARMLSQEEKPLCRALWQEIFTEDSEAFLDYYDRWKTKENQCYGIFDGDRLVSMLELNPYRLMVQGHEAESRYIIAVATRPEYRHQGLMKRLLKKSLEDMRAEGLPLLYLMPAAEAIYHPFGFRFVYAANAGTAEPEEWKSGDCESEVWAEIFSEPERITADEPQEFDRIITEILEFSDRVLPRISDCYTKRDAAYYRTLLAELKSERGGLILVRKQGALIGLVPFWGEEKTEIREVLSLPEDGELVLKTAVSEIAGNRRIQPFNTAISGAEIPVMGASFPMDGKKPIIMARICHAERFLELFHLKTAEAEQELELHLTDALIPENSGIYRWYLTEHGSHAEKSGSGNHDAKTVFCTEAELVSWLLGNQTEGFPEQVQTCRTPFINEIV